MTNFPSYFDVDLKIKDPRATIVARCWPRIYIQWLMHKDKLSPPKRFRGEHLNCS
jgi:hypothetical protein